MRISSLQLSSSMMHNLNRSGAKLGKLTEQMATEKRILVPSDDPIGSTRLVQLNREQASINQFQKNITRLSGSLSQQESHLDAVSKQLLAVRDKVLAANNDTTGSKDINGYGSELGAMLDSIVSTLNSKNEEGRYSFSGTKTDTQPIVFDETTGKYVYKGNTETRDVTVANGERVKENTTAGDMFFNGTNDLLNDLNELAKMMKDPNTDFSSPTYKDALHNIIDSVDHSIDFVTSTIGELGARQNRLTLLDEAHQDIKTSNDSVIRDILDLDFADAAFQLKGQMFAIEASQSVFAQVSKLSLFDVI